MKRIIMFITAVLVVGILASCTVYVDRPNAGVYVRPAPEFYTMRMYDNQYVFYDNSQAVAAWIFMADGTVIKEGIPITGIVRVYYDNGYLFSEVYYRDNVRDGLCRQYYQDGTLMFSGNYSGGYRHGSWRSFAFGRADQAYASFEFSGRGDEIPQNFNPQMDGRAREGYEMMQIEERYAGGPAVSRVFTASDAEPEKFSKQFGSTTALSSEAQAEAKKAGEQGNQSLPARPKQAQMNYVREKTGATAVQAAGPAVKQQKAGARGRQKQPKQATAPQPAENKQSVRKKNKKMKTVPKPEQVKGQIQADPTPQYKAVQSAEKKHEKHKDGQ